MTRIAPWILLLGLAGCGDVAYQDPEPVECEPTAGGEEGTADELSELMAEVIAPRICERVIGSFIGLPGDEGHEGAAGGLDPSVGRWWIRRCQGRVQDGRLRVDFGGPGWTWLDRESTGFRVRQYLRFDAAASMEASLHVGYDRQTRIASVWLRPQPGVQATVTPTGLVRAEATGVFSSVLGGILSLAGDSPDARARTQAADEGSERLSAKLQTGFTITFHLDTEQLDFMLGQLPRGQTPQRPWAPDGVTWLVNERSSVWPGGIDVVGPIAADSGPVQLDVELEEGEGAVIRQICAEPLHQWLQQAWAGEQPAALTGTIISTLRSARIPQHPALSPMECPSLLVITTTEGARTPASLRFRLTSQEARENPHSNGPSLAAGTATTTAPGSTTPNGPGTTPTAPPPTAARALRIRIQRLTISDRNVGDMFGGDPDPYVVVMSVRQGREIHRTATVDDSREARFDQWLPSAVPAEALPVRLVVYDEDVAGDEVVGTAQIDASALTGGEQELALPLRARGDSGTRQTGVLHVTVQPER